MKKKVTIHTSLFELQLYWRTKTVCAQLVFMAVLGFMVWLGVNSAVRKFSLTLLLLDIVVVLLYALVGLQVSSEEITEADVKPDRSKGKEKGEKKVEAKGNSVDEAEVDHKKVDKKKVVTESSATINNMVGGNIKVPKASQADKPATSPQPQPDILSPEEAAGKNLEDADMDALMNFFGDGIEL